jgi:hypothetical protein
MTEQDIIRKLRTDKKARKTYLANLKKRYDQYRSEDGDQTALRWALGFLGPAIWNELFAYKGSSYPINLAGLTRRDAHNIAQAARAYHKR